MVHICISHIYILVVSILLRLGQPLAHPFELWFLHVCVDFVVLGMDIYHQILLILGRPFLSTTRATIDVAAWIIKLNISRKEETFTFKAKGMEKCN
jgi:hypothetical protein